MSGGHSWEWKEAGDLVQLHCRHVNKRLLLNKLIVIIRRRILISGMLWVRSSYLKLLMNIEPMDLQGMATSKIWTYIHRQRMHFCWLIFNFTGFFLSCVKSTGEPVRGSFHICYQSFISSIFMCLFLIVCIYLLKYPICLFIRTFNILTSYFQFPVQ